LNLEEYCLISSVNELTPSLYEALPEAISCHGVFISVVKSAMKRKSTCNLFLQIQGANAYKSYHLFFSDGKIHGCDKAGWDFSSITHTRRNVMISVDDNITGHALLVPDLENIGLNYDELRTCYTYSKEF